MDDDLEALSPTIGGPTEEDLTLPKATLAKLINELLPGDFSCAKETRDILGDCCVEFIHLLASEANEICEKEQRKTISGEHVMQALKSLGFESFIQHVQETQEEHTKSLKDREKKSFRLENSGLTPEELLRSQEELFAKARMRLNGQQVDEPAQEQVKSEPVVDTTNDAVDSKNVALEATADA